MAHHVAVLVGSLRKASINRKLAQALEAEADQRLTFEHLPIGALPLYDDDLWADVPAAVADLKRRVEAADGVLIVTPEYNRSVPGVLANAFDWLSRPSGKSSWARKPAAICGATPGATGTAAAQQHARVLAVNLGMVPMTFPELYVTWNADRFADDGTVRSGDTRKLLQAYIHGFAAWIEQHGSRGDGPA